MTGPEHYLKAQEELDRAYVEPIDTGDAGYHLGRAQVHATLALAAATAMNGYVKDGVPGMARPDFEAWDRVAGVQP